MSTQVGASWCTRAAVRTISTARDLRNQQRQMHNLRASISRPAFKMHVYQGTSTARRWHEFRIGAGKGPGVLLSMTNQVTRIVVGTDFSDTALVALEQAFELAAREVRGEVHVVNAVQHLGELVQMDLPEMSAYQLPLTEAQERLEAYVGGHLSAWQARTHRTFSRCSTYLSTDFPVEAIVQLAADLQAQLVVVGTHGRRGVRRFFLGSVAEGVVRIAHTPVLVVRPADQTAKVPQIEPPCPRCVAARQASAGKDLWCEQHSEKHGRRHVYHFESRLSRDGNLGTL